MFVAPLFIDFYDPAHSDNEERYLVIGRSEAERLFLMPYTERGGKTRIISARLATRRE